MAAKFFKTIWRRLAILFLIATLSLQGIPLSTIFASGTSGWVDGDLPQMTLGEQTESTAPPTCSPTVFTYYSYTKPNGSFDSLGREVQKQVCATQNELGFFGSTSPTTTPDFYDYVKPHTANAFRVIDVAGRGSSLLPVPNQQSFIFRKTDGSLYGGKSLRFYDSFIGAGAFHPVYGSINELAFQLQEPLAEPLRDSGGNIVQLMNSYAFSQNGEWMLIEAEGLGFVRINTQTRDMRLIRAEQFRYSIGQTITFQLAISNDGNSAISTTFDGAVRVYDLTNCQPAPFVFGATSNQVDPGCKSREVRQSIIDQVGTFRGIYQMQFSPDGQSIAGKFMRNEGGVNKHYRFTYSVAGYVPPPPLAYLALGDSFSSGEGEVGANGFDHYIYGTNTTDPKNICHASDRSYPYLVAETLGITANFHSVACSGAKVDPHYWSKPQYNNSNVFALFPGEETQSDFVVNARPEVVTLSMIGNDIGFSDKILRCLEWADPCFHFKEDRESIANEIYDKFDTLVDMYEDIQRTSGGARVYALGYPQLMSATGECGSNTPFDPEEREMARGLVTYLNAVIKAATEKSGVQYIDVENAFAGHQLCEPGTKAVNGLTTGDDVLSGLIPVGNESFHPNSLGHQLFAQALLAQSNNLAKPMPVLKDQNGQVVDVDMTVAPPYVGSASYLALLGNAPGGGVYRRTAYTILSGADAIVEGVPFVPEPVKQLLKPGSISDTVLNSEPVKIGTLTTNDQGELVGEIVIPEGTTPGFHTLHVYAQDIAGQEIDLNQTVYVAASATDYDGDGVLNEDEKCLAVEPANQDADRDGIDDACDPEIGEVPSDTTPPEVVGAPDREANANGWYNDDVTINWAATDPEPSSGAPTQPASTIADQEGTATYTSDQSCDPLNNCATGSLELKIDKTAPDITYAISPSPTVAGWNNSAVTVTFACSDETSGVAGCSTPEIVSGTDGVYVVAGYAADNAGNTSSVNVLVSLDGTVPTVTQSVSPATNGDGWHNSDVTVAPTCDDNLSGVLDCSPLVTLSTEGANQVVASSATDNAGNTSTTSTSINIDKTAPTLGVAEWASNPKSILGTATISVPAADNLSGITEAEYYLGDADPGQGNGATMQVNDGSISVDFNTDFPTGVYKVTVRAKDKAGSWSDPISDYLVVYDPFGTRMTGRRTLIPSLANGDILPGLIGANQDNKARFGFNVRYDKDGQIHKNNDFQFKYETGTKCNKPTQAQNCHSFELNATSISWLTTQGQNDSTGIFQGTAELQTDGVTSAVVFRLIGLDGERLDETSEDHLTLKVYAEGANPNTDSPIYQVSAEVLRGNIKIRKW